MEGEIRLLKSWEDQRQETEVLKPQIVSIKKSAKIRDFFCIYLRETKKASDLSKAFIVGVEGFEPPTLCL
jgi:hypothetical protein